MVKDCEGFGEDMSIMRCEKHDNWDSDFHEICPRCEISVDYWIERAETAEAQCEKMKAVVEAATELCDREHHFRPYVYEQLDKAVRAA